MLVVPKLELAGGACAPLGDAGALGSNEPLTVIRAWVAEGFSRLQVVDRDALAGRGSNMRLIEVIGRDGSIDLDLVVGADSTEQIEECLEAGASRVVLGPRALAEGDWLASVADSFPGTLMVETSVRERRVVTRGWVRTLAVDLLDLVADLGGVPLAGLLVTSLDGAAGDGLELAFLEDVVDAYELPVFVEETRPTMNDLRAFEHRGLAGVVVPGPTLATLLDARLVASEFGA
jgi:phosphoribosylformimino-5-aminoimidazole carboxamide ribonucleotide (ProFAR) isomerase